LLTNKFKLGYILGIAVFSSFGILQAGFAGAIFIGVKCPFNLAMAITISLCCLSIASLILNGDKLTNNITQMWIKNKT
jgi:hypothetical protein